MRNFRTFTWKDSHLKIYSREYDLVTKSFVSERKKLEAYILRHPEFQSALTPVKLLSGAPMIAMRMAKASEATGLGPMASVAGTLAQLAVEAAKEIGCENVLSNKKME